MAIMTGGPVGDWQLEHLQNTFPEYLIACEDGRWMAQRGDDEDAGIITRPSGRLLQVAILEDIALRAYRAMRDRNGSPE